MRILSVAVGLVIFSTVASAQEMSSVTVKKETALGPLKSVEGTIPNVAPSGKGPVQAITVWVNGYSTHPNFDGVWKILIPN